MAVLARFYVASITRRAYNPGAGAVELTAVARGPENSAWASATPSGSVNMVIGNAGALTWFNDRLGKEVMLTFEDPTE